MALSQLGSCLMSTYPFSLLGLLSPADPTRPPAAPSLCRLSTVPTCPLLLKASPLEAFGRGGEREAIPGSWEGGGEQVDESHSSIPPSSG